MWREGDRKMEPLMSTEAPRAGVSSGLVGTQRADTHETLHTGSPGLPVPSVIPRPSWLQGPELTHISPG